MLTRVVLGTLLLTACGSPAKAPSTAASGGRCPPAVTTAVATAYPGQAQDACKAEHEKGKDIFEVAVTNGDGGKIEIDVSPDGTILQTEEVISTVALPAAVAKAFAAKYPGDQATRVEKIGIPNKPAMYELTFGDKEATFSDAGEFVEEEGGD